MPFLIIFSSFKNFSSSEIFSINNYFSFFIFFCSKHFKLNRGPDTEITIKNSYFEAVFDSDTGMLIDIGMDGGELKKANIRFMKYGTVASKDRSGAYLFLPDGQATVSSQEFFILINDFRFLLVLSLKINK